MRNQILLFPIRFGSCGIPKVALLVMADIVDFIELTYSMQGGHNIFLTSLREVQNSSEIAPNLNITIWRAAFWLLFFNGVRVT